ncbi:nitrite reductase [Paenibacillus sp. HJL G12]|uniref:Nitrite reductase n=1 Tax=Paenibacillus dendrobii TaxID=2691084 RepID=A0A7X3LGY5_9BACL|nr:nitrite reductase [Paenibacillus dendrobii]MWV42983.1 nitrite reductase [Paenibacillus dendrobii]
MSDFIKIAVSTPIQIGGNVISQEQLNAIASAAGPNAGIEITPFRQIYIELPPDEKDQVEEKLIRAGLEVYPAGAVIKGLIACQFCNGAEAAGLSTARSINRAIAGIETPAPLKLGYAGCALGTSEPLLKDMSVVKMKDTFNIYVGGEPKGIKTVIAELLVAGLEENQIIPILIKIIDHYKANAKGKEKFSKFVRRTSVEALREVIGY